jgi:hypothetical protein
VVRAQVVLPSSSAGSALAVSSGISSPMDGEGDDPKQQLPRSVLQKILKRGSEEDEAPLTTAAVRELQRAQKERVYDRTLIKVK